MLWYARRAPNEKKKNNTESNNVSVSNQQIFTPYFIKSGVFVSVKIAM